MLIRASRKVASILNSFRRNSRILEISAEVTSKRLSYLGTDALYDLGEAARNIEIKRLQGIFVETGCALGGSSIVLAAAKAKHRELFCYDVFGTIPPPSTKDGVDVHRRYEAIAKGESTGIEGDQYYGYIDNLYDQVVKNFISFGFDLAENRINLIKGLYQDTLNIEMPVSLAHIDCDWYEPVLLSLKKIEPFLVPGGVLIIDDYYAYSGCKKAVDEYFEHKKKAYKFLKKSRLHIIKL
jgi:SAM-dependent methyltransferase